MADRFEIHYLKFKTDTVHIGLTNTKFRSNAQAAGRVTSTLQRFTSDAIKFAKISFYSQNLRSGVFRVDLEKVTNLQFNPLAEDENNPSFTQIDTDLNTISWVDNNQRLSWGLGPYFAHRLFNPDLPLSMETGVEFAASYQFAPGLKISGSIRKSVLTNLTDNKRRSNSLLPRVHSDWPLYDLAGQKGHIHELSLSYLSNLAPGLYGRARGGYWNRSSLGLVANYCTSQFIGRLVVGIDIHRVRKRDYDMRFDLLDYETTTGHVSLYYDAAGIFNIEINAGRYLAGDWGPQLRSPVNLEADGK